MLEPHFGTLLYNKISHSLLLFLDEGKTFPKTVLSWGSGSVFLRKNSLQRRKNAEKRLDINSQECDYISSWVPEKKTKKNIEAYRFFLIFHFSDIAARSSSRREYQQVEWDVFLFFWPSFCKILSHHNLF